MNAAADHYVCTCLHTVPTQVGPLTLLSAQALVRYIKDKSGRVGYNTWVDWRRFDACRLIDTAQFHTEFASIISGQRPAPPTLPLGHLSDNILAAELRKRGYTVTLRYKKHYLGLNGNGSDHQQYGLPT